MAAPQNEPLRDRVEEIKIDAKLEPRSQTRLFTVGVVGERVHLSESVHPSLSRSGCGTATSSKDRNTAIEKGVNTFPS